MTQEEKFVRKELEKVYPQLVINSQKTCGAGYDKWGHDLLALCVMIYLEKPLEVQLKVIADGKLENYITYLMGFQLKLGTTTFYHKYRKHNEKQRDLLPNFEYEGFTVFNDAFDDEPSECYSCVKQEIDKLDPYKKMLINEIVIEKNTYTKVSRRYKINYHHLKYDTQKILKQIKLKCQHLLTS